MDQQLCHMCERLGWPTCLTSPSPCWPQHTLPCPSLMPSDQLPCCPCPTYHYSATSSLAAWSQCSQSVVAASPTTTSNTATARQGTSQTSTQERRRHATKVSLHFAPPSRKRQSHLTNAWSQPLHSLAGQPAHIAQRRLCGHPTC